MAEDHLKIQVSKKDNEVYITDCGSLGGTWLALIKGVQEPIEYNVEYKSEEIKEFRFFKGQRISKIESIMMYFNEYELIEPLYLIGCTTLKNFRKMEPSKL